MFQGEGQTPAHFRSGAPMPIPVTGDDSVEAAMIGWANKFAGGTSRLHLFSNNFLPLPNSPISDFVECTFAGYAAIALTTVFTGPTNPTPGLWQYDSGVLTFNCTGGSQVVYGWYIQFGSHFFEAGQLFDNPITMTAGMQLQIELRPQGITQFIL